MDVGWVQVSSSSVCVERVASLVVARLVQGAKVVPDLGNVGIQTNGTRVSVKRVSVLIDLVVEHADRAPESRVPAVAINSLLVGLVRLRILLL